MVQVGKAIHSTTWGHELPMLDDVLETQVGN